MKDQGVLKEQEIEIHVIPGSLMNEVYGLIGENRYKDGLNIVCVKLHHFNDIGRLAVIKLQVGARWFNDIVDNNAARNRVH